MDRTASVFLRWAGRAFILLAAFILVASLFLPDAVQPVGDAVCPDNTVLDNHRYVPEHAPDNEKLELVCTSPTYTESAAKPVLAIVVGFMALGLIAIWFSSRMTRTSMSRPSVPQMH
jgi:hypothetical protein